MLQNVIGNFRGDCTSQELELLVHLSLIDRNQTIPDLIS